MSTVSQPTFADQVLAWADTCPIRIKRLPCYPALREIAQRRAQRVGRQMGDEQIVNGFVAGHNAVAAIVRHRYTNYEGLIDDLRSMGLSRSMHFFAYEIIRQRIDQAVEERLDRLL